MLDPVMSSISAPVAGPLQMTPASLAESAPPESELAESAPPESEPPESEPPVASEVAWASVPPSWDVELLLELQPND
jgi:hypothetical protein